MGRTTEKKTKPASGGRKQTQIRMDDALRSRILRYQEEESTRVGYEVGFSAIVRKLIEKGLEA